VKVLIGVIALSMFVSIYSMFTDAEPGVVRRAPRPDEPSSASISRARLWIDDAHRRCERAPELRAFLETHELTGAITAAVCIRAPRRVGRTRTRPSLQRRDIAALDVARALQPMR
jgi:hypothetical protein